MRGTRRRRSEVRAKDEADWSEDEGEAFILPFGYDQRTQEDAPLYIIMIFLGSSVFF